MRKNLIKAVEKVLKFMNGLELSQSEANVVSQYVTQTLKYNDLKESLTEEIKNDILEELKKLQKKK